MPLFWFRCASTGSPPQRYTLQIPFKLGPAHSLDQGESSTFHYGDLDIELIDNEGIHLLRVKGFKTTSDAEVFLPRLYGALLRIIVVRKIGLRATAALQHLTLCDPPVDIRGDPNCLMQSRGWTHLDGWVEPSPAVVIPEHLRIMEAGIGAVSLRLGMPVPKFIDGLINGLSLPTPERIAADERLSLSIDLYAASLWETTPRARVIGLTNSLEALITPERLPTFVSGMVDTLLAVVDDNRDRSAEDDDRRRHIDGLLARLAHLKTESISESLRQCVARHAHAMGEPEDDARRSMATAYSVRSKLLHRGHVANDDVKSAASWLDKAVPAILESLITHAATSTER